MSIKEYCLRVLLRKLPKIAIDLNTNVINLCNCSSFIGCERCRNGRSIADILDMEVQNIKKRVIFVKRRL